MGLTVASKERAMVVMVVIEADPSSVTFKVNFRYGSLCTKNELEVQFNEF